MALIRHLADLKTGEKPAAARRLLLIDEPELYLHPQGVKHLRQALAALSQKGFQVIYATHSPLMLSRENAADAMLFERTRPWEPLRDCLSDMLLLAPLMMLRPSLEHSSSWATSPRSISVILSCCVRERPRNVFCHCSMSVCAGATQS